MDNEKNLKDEFKKADIESINLWHHREIRTATINDLEAVAAVEAECFPAAEAATKEEFAERIKFYGDHFWLMFDADKLIAFVDAEMPVVVIATRNGLYEKVLSNIQEIKARKGRVIAIVTKGDTVISKIADTCIELPETMECLDPLITTVPLQLLAYHIAVCKGMDVDQPRNLAKSVTVE